MNAYRSLRLPSTPARGLRAAALYGLVLAGCASQTPAPASAPKPAARATRAEPAEPPKPSAYEERWQSACAQADTGRCPAPFDRPGAYFGIEDENGFAPPDLCDAGAQPIDAQTSEALSQARRALRACLKGAAPSAWVDIAVDAKEPVTAAEGLPQRSIDCVTKLVRRSLSSQPGVKRVVVLGSASKGKTKSQAEPALSKETVSALINDHAAEISSCYDGALEVWPGLRGRHKARVVVWFDGSIALVRTQETLGNPALECCINTAIASWKFAAPEDGNIVLVTLPFKLGPDE